MKKIVISILLICFMFCLTACNKEASDASQADSSNTHTHSYSDATCTEPAKCSCGATKGSALGHTKWSEWELGNLVDDLCTMDSLLFRRCYACGTQEDKTNNKYNDRNQREYKICFY